MKMISFKCKIKTTSFASKFSLIASYDNGIAVDGASASKGGLKKVGTFPTPK